MLLEGRRVPAGYRSWNLSVCYFNLILPQRACIGAELGYTYFPVVGVAKAYSLGWERALTELDDEAGSHIRNEVLSSVPPPVGPGVVGG